MQTELCDKRMYHSLKVLIPLIPGLEVTIAALSPASISVFELLAHLVKQDLHVSRPFSLHVVLLDDGYDMCLEHEVLSKVALGLEEQCHLILSWYLLDVISMLR